LSNVITLTGFKEFEAKLKSLPQSITIKADAIVQDEALRWSQLAKRSAPVNFGKLRGGIQAVPTGQMRAEVVSPVKYSPYMEWGTGTKVNVPTELLQYALQFKGQKKVLGISPHAFFFIHKEAVSKTLNSRLLKILNTPV
jgi:hypothetical protein